VGRPALVNVMERIRAYGAAGGEVGAKADAGLR